MLIVGINTGNAHVVLTDSKTGKVLAEIYNCERPAQIKIGIEAPEHIRVTRSNYKRKESKDGRQTTL